MLALRRGSLRLLSRRASGLPSVPRDSPANRGGRGSGRGRGGRGRPARPETEEDIYGDHVDSLKPIPDRPNPLAWLDEEKAEYPELKTWTDDTELDVDWTNQMLRGRGEPRMSDPDNSEDPGDIDFLVNASKHMLKRVDYSPMRFEFATQLQQGGARNPNDRKAKMRIALKDLKLNPEQERAAKMICGLRYKAGSNEIVFISDKHPTLLQNTAEVMRQLNEVYKYVRGSDTPFTTLPPPRPIWDTPVHKFMYGDTSEDKWGTFFVRKRPVQGASRTYDPRAEKRQRLLLEKEEHKEQMSRVAAEAAKREAEEKIFQAELEKRKEATKAAAGAVAAIKAQAEAEALSAVTVDTAPISSEAAASIAVKTEAVPTNLPAKTDESAASLGAGSVPPATSVVATSSIGSPAAKTDESAASPGAGSVPPATSVVAATSVGSPAAEVQTPASKSE